MLCVPLMSLSSMFNGGKHRKDVRKVRCTHNHRSRGSTGSRSSSGGGDASSAKSSHDGSSSVTMPSSESTRSCESRSRSSSNEENVWARCPSGDCWQRFREQARERGEEVFLYDSPGSDDDISECWEMQMAITLQEEDDA